MTDGIRITIDMSDYSQSMGEFEAKIPSIMEKIIKSVTDYASGRMKLRAPVDTGHLRGSIEKRFPSAYEAFVTPTAEYGIYVELKWPKLGKTYSSHAKIPSSTGFVADTAEDTIGMAEKIANDIVEKELIK